METNPMSSNGIHHVTAIAGHAQRNLDFYTRTLGLRLVKKTVNFDDPGAYHLYYGDAEGTPAPSSPSSPGSMPPPAAPAPASSRRRCSASRRPPSATGPRG
jgi:catechol 2,3-dioxygenase-like lactoylglutathione lyase family enzyme